MTEHKNVYRVYGYIRVQVEIDITAESGDLAKKEAKKYGSEAWSCDIEDQIHPPAMLYVEQL